MKTRKEALAMCGYIGAELVNELYDELDKYKDLANLNHRRYTDASEHIDKLRIEIASNEKRVENAVSTIEPSESLSLTKADMDWIITLSTLMLTQDTRCTAQPYALILTEREIQVRGRDHASNCGLYWDDSFYESDQFDEFKSDIKEHFYNDGIDQEIEEALNEIDGFYELDGSNLSEVLKDKYNHDFNGHEVWYEDNANFFFTENGYGDYIKRNGHNLKSPQSYGIHLTRNDEMKKVIDIIHKVANIGKSERYSWFNSIIRRYITISEEVRFLNSNKKFIQIEIIGTSVKMSLSNKYTDGAYTRDEFIIILNDRSWLDKNEEREK